MDRREAIKATSLILGYSLSASAIAAVMHGCRTESRMETEDASTVQEWTPVFFEPAEVELVEEMAETILPATGTPGARDVRVHEFIDLMVKNHYPLRDQRAFRRGLEKVDMMSTDMAGGRFLDVTPDDRKRILEAMDEEAHTQRRDGTAELTSAPFFQMFKELTFLGYFTSELIGENHLSYDPIPGTYAGCIPAGDVGNTWSL